MAKTTGTVTVKRSRNGTTIRATGAAAQALFDAIGKSAEHTAAPLRTVGVASDSPTQSLPIHKEDAT